MLKRLRDNNLYAKISKCRFFQTEVTFLGHQVSEKGIGMMGDKLQAILDWPTLTTVKEVQQFLGLANYYRKFTPHFSKIAVPLTKLLKKDQVWKWTSVEQKAFNDLKSAFVDNNVLIHHDPTKAYSIECDASDFALGGVLSQEDSDGNLRPVSFYSRKFTPAEQNYEVHDKELLAIKACLKNGVTIYWVPKIPFMS